MAVFNVTCLEFPPKATSNSGHRKGLSQRFLEVNENEPFTKTIIQLKHKIDALNFELQKERGHTPSLVIRKLAREG